MAIKFKELQSIAPLLAAVAGGSPAIAAGAIGLLVDALDISSSSSVEDIPKEIKKRIQDDPNVVTRLKQLERDNQQYLRSVQLQMVQAEYADRANARAREVAITAATGSRDWYVAVLGAFVVLAFTLVLGMMVFKPVKEDKIRSESSVALINILVGALTAGYSTVLAYYFGSSTGSKSKDGTIASMTQQSESLSPPLEPPAGQRETWRDP